MVSCLRRTGGPAPLGLLVVFQGGAGRPHPGADEEGEQFLQHLGPAADRGLHGQHLPRSLPNIFHEYVGSRGAARSSGLGKWGGDERREQQEAAWLPGYGVSAAVALVDLGEPSSSQGGTWLCF